MGTLFIVATPIGNLEDTTLRAIRVLKEVDLIACEDTRVTKKLLDRFLIKTPTISYFQHSKLSKIEYLIEQLRLGKNIALVSDAGTPGISDPGQALIAQIQKSNIKDQNDKSKLKNNNLNSHSDPALAGEESSPEGAMRPEPRSFASYTQDDNGRIKVVPIPGPSALTSAASVSGMIEKEFYFAGFLPKKKGRQTEFKKLIGLDVPIVIYESAMRIERTLNDILRYFGDQTEVCIAREMTKMFEEYWGGAIEEVIFGLKEHKIKGEIVIIVKKSKI